MIKAILFDLDGTLINTNRLIMESFKYAFRTILNMEMEEEKIVRFFGEPLINSMNKVDAERAKELITAFRVVNESQHDHLAEKYEGVEEAVKALKTRGIKVGIVTSKRMIMTERSLKLINLYNEMDVIITPEATDKHKPHGAPAILACDRLGVLPEEAIMVGDSIHDVQCGKNAGNKTCIVTYSTFAMEELLSYKPDYVIDRLIELVDIIESDKIERIV